MKKEEWKECKAKKADIKAGNHFESELFLLDDASSEYGPGFVFLSRTKRRFLADVHVAAVM